MLEFISLYRLFVYLFVYLFLFSSFPGYNVYVMDLVIPFQYYFNNTQNDKHLIHIY